MNLEEQMEKNDWMIGFIPEFENLLELFKAIIVFSRKHKMNTRLLFQPSINNLESFSPNDLVCLVETFPTREIYHSLHGKVKKALFLVVEGGKDEWYQTLPVLHP